MTVDTTYVNYVMKPIYVNASAEREPLRGSAETTNTTVKSGTYVLTR